MNTSESPYLISEELQRIVNAAQLLEKPLLLKGEPGTGKTSLAYELARKENLKLISWQIKSTTRAQDGLYTYDTVQRLNDSRFGDGEVSNIGNYIKMGALGQAFQSEERCIVLIDEIDKADVEFPNDLLHELDAMDFVVNETGEKIQAKYRPLVIITSNAERELPDAFLRRCLFHYIAFPDEEFMRQILDLHFSSLASDLLNTALERFFAIRNIPGLRKKPSTSELIDWIRVLLAEKIPAAQLEEIKELGVLLKRDTDISKVQRFVQQQNRL